MAIYHLSANGVAPSRGASAVKASAYLSGRATVRALTGELCEYARCERVLATGLEAPEAAPEWARDPARLWNEAERAWSGGQALVARRENVALPRELGGDLAAMEALVRDYARADVEAGFAVEWAIHAPDGDNGNWHAHLMRTALTVGTDGFEQPKRGKSTKSYLCRDPEGRDCFVLAADWKAAKAEGYEKVFNFKDGKRRSMSEAKAEGLGKGDRKGRDAVAVTVSPNGARAYDAEKAALRARRERWAKCVNSALERSGSAARVDHRSNRDRGIANAPTVHEGPTVTKVERAEKVRCESAGFKYEPVTRVARENAAVRLLNVAIAAAREAVSKAEAVVRSLREAADAMRRGEIMPDGRATADVRSEVAARLRSKSRGRADSLAGSAARAKNPDKAAALLAAAERARKGWGGREAGSSAISTSRERGQTPGTSSSGDVRGRGRGNSR